MGKFGIGLQLWTLRNEMEHDIEATLREVAKMGYEGVEFAGYFGWEAKKLKSLLDELGLKTIASHVSLQSLTDDLQHQIDYLKTLEATYIICPYVMPNDRESAEQWQELIALFSHIGKQTAKQGLTFLYHNHDFEFYIKIENEFVFDAIYHSTSKEDVQVEMDVCWVQYAGQDPISYIHKYAGRLPLLHFKDFTKNPDGSILTVELGKGQVDLDQVISAAKKANVKWLIVEQDECQKTPLESVANNLNWVKQKDLHT